MKHSSTVLVVSHGLLKSPVSSTIRVYSIKLGSTYQGAQDGQPSKKWAVPAYYGGGLVRKRRLVAKQDWEEGHDCVMALPLHHPQDPLLPPLRSQ